MMLTELRIVLSMAFLRLLAGTIEITAALLMIKFAKVQTAVKLNALLGLIGTIILILVSSLGLIGVSHQVSYNKTILVAIGVILIFIGTR